MNRTENAETFDYDDCRLPAEAILLAGTYLPTADTWAPFAPAALDFLDNFSRMIKKAGRHMGNSEVMALAFWCRRSHIRLLRQKHAKAELTARLGRGRIFHLAPANIPLMFFYTYAIGLLAGNAGIVRISERTLRSESAQAVLKVLCILFKQKEHAAISDRSCFISYARNDTVTEQILRFCDGRVLWGGDETILQMRRIPMPPHAVELTFPDRVSLAVIDEDALGKMEEEKIRSLVHRFYNDTYVMDQNGCSSPQTVIWLTKGPGTVDSGAQHRTGEQEILPAETADHPVRERWWEMLAQEAETSYEIDGFRAARKLEKAVLATMRPSLSRTIDTFRRYHGNLLYVLRLATLPVDLASYKGGFGLFYETETDAADKIFGSFSNRIQTIVCIGVQPEILAAYALARHSPGALRFVQAGEALQMETIWDGTDLITALSRKI